MDIGRRCSVPASKSRYFDTGRQARGRPERSAKSRVRGDTVMSGYWGSARWNWRQRCAPAGCTPVTSVLSTSADFSPSATEPRTWIISGGSNIYPREVEEALLEGTPILEEVAVIGVPDEGVGRKRHGRCWVAAPRGGRSISIGSKNSFCSASHASSGPNIGASWTSFRRIRAGKVLKRESRQQFSGMRDGAR